MTVVFLCINYTDFSNGYYVYPVLVRLAGANRRPNAGRLEIKYNDTWGTVCDDAFDDTDAQVACDMLGFGYICISF